MMVDLALLQSVSYIAGALGVCIAAIFYVLNLRISQRNQELMLKAQQQTLETRQTQLLMQLSDFITTKEGMRNYLEFNTMEWRDYDDFERKYGSDTDLDNCANRMTMWYSYDNLGAMLRSGLMDAETLYSSTMFGAYEMWAKFEEVIIEQRRHYNSATEFVNWEYLAKEMLRIRLLRDPSYKIPASVLKYVPDK